MAPETETGRIASGLNFDLRDTRAHCVIHGIHLSSLDLVAQWRAGTETHDPTKWTTCRPKATIVEGISLSQ